MKDLGGVRVNSAGLDNLPTRPLISVCVPLYNNAATIERCLRSILAQDGARFEIIVVDDDSTDDGAAIAQRMLRPGDRYVKNTPRLGLNGNHNKCLELARGELIQYVHGDDWLLDGALRTLATYFDDPDVGLAFAPRDIDSTDANWKKWCSDLHEGFRDLSEFNSGPELVAQIAARGAYGNWIGEPTCVMFRRDLALAGGSCRTDIYQLVDYDLWLRLMLRSRRVCFHRNQLSVHSYTPSTATARIVGARKDWLDRLRILTWLIVDPASPKIVRSRAKLWWRAVWLKSIMSCAVSGPAKRQRVRYLLSARDAEFRIAERFLAADVSTVGATAFVEPRQQQPVHLDSELSVA